jgi:selenocysteine lyase/cysteine desulfurase
MSIARRDFLRTLGGAAVAGGLAGYGMSPEAAASALPAFGFADDSVPMNAANLCPMPLAVRRAQEHYAQALDLDLSPDNRHRIEALKEEARSRIAALLGVLANELAVVRNTSEANNVIVQGIPLKHGDEVVLWDQNHPSNSVAWDVQASRSGATVRRFAVPVDAASVEEVVDLFVSAVGANTKVLAFTHISNSTGFRTPLAEICAAVRRQQADVHIHIDGAQTWGAVAIDLGAIDCDSFSGSAHKWFMGPREVGILYVRERHIDRIWPNVVSVPWGSTTADAPQGARKFDALGQRDDAAIAALTDAAAFHEVMTPAGVESRSAMLAGRLREGLENLGLPFVSSSNPEFASSVIVLRASGENAAKLVDEIHSHAGIITAAVGGLRMSPHVYNSEEHVDRVVAAIGKARALLA